MEHKEETLTLKKVKGHASSYRTSDGKYYVCRVESGYWCWGKIEPDGSSTNIDGEDYYRKYEAVEMLQEHIKEQLLEEELWNS